MALKVTDFLDLQRVVMPHTVQIRDRDSVADALDWCMDKGRPGIFMRGSESHNVYIDANGYVRNTPPPVRFHFSDENTAMEFKVRWG